MIKRALSAMIVATLALAGLVATPAHAARTEGFTIKNAIVKDNPESDIPGRPGTFSFDWSIAERPKAGEGFEIVPNYLLMTGKRWEELPMTAGDTEIGICVLEPVLISCTVDDRIAQLPENAPVEGHVETPMQRHYMAATTRALPSGDYAPTIRFSVNSKPLDVAIPNGIAGSLAPDTPVKVSEATPYSVDRPVEWTLDFHPTHLANRDPQAYKTPDSTTQLSYKFTVDSSVQFAEDFQAKPWELREIESRSPVASLVTTSNSPANGFEIAVTENGNTKEITVQGPFKPEHRYSLYLPTKFHTALKPKETATITVQLESYGKPLTLPITNPQTGLFENGYGLVTVRGLSSTDIPVPYDTHLYGDLTYDLPEDTKASDYPDWEDRPRGIADDDQSGTIKVEYKFLGSSYRIAIFPEGTKVSLRPREAQWPRYKYDPTQTTIDPAEMTVAPTPDNRFTVTYAITGDQGSFKVGVEVTGPEEAVRDARSTKSTVSWTCTKDGQEIESGEETISTTATKHFMSSISLFEGSECTITQQPPQIAGYRLDADQSVLEQKVTVTADMDSTLFKNHYVEEVQQQPQAEIVSEEASTTETPEETIPATE